LGVSRIAHEVEAEFDEDEFFPDDSKVMRWLHRQIKPVEVERKMTAHDRLMFGCITAIYVKRALADFLLRWLWLLLLTDVALGVVAVVKLSPSHRWWYEKFLPWLEPVSTSLAFGAAAVAALYAVRVHKREERRDERFEEMQFRAQASKFSAWHDETRPKGLFVLNRSESVISGVHIMVIDFDLRTVAYGRGGAVPPKDEPYFVPIEIPDNMETYFWVHFVDASGVAWWRNSNGVLQRDQPRETTVLGSWESVGDPR
jgi:hypothetical protein